MRKFEVFIKISFFNEDINFNEFYKEYIYHSKNNEICTDEIIFKTNEIKISGERKKSINSEEFLYTKKSRAYRECVSSLLFIYFKYGNFKIEEIKFNNSEVTGYYQKFEKKPANFLNDKVLNLLFDYRDDTAYIPLMHIIEGSYYQEYGLEHSWKAFNYIYNIATGNNNDKEAVKKIIDILKENEAEFKLILEKAKKKVGGISTDNIINYACKNEKTISKCPERFLNSIEISRFEDKGFIKFIKFNFNKIYKKYKDDYEENKETGNYKYDGYTKVYANRIKYLDKLFKKEKEIISDYIMFLLFFIQYLRNKSMHGVFQSPSFLFNTKYTDELQTYSDFVFDLCIELLNKNIYTLKEQESIN